MRFRPGLSAGDTRALLVGSMLIAAVLGVGRVLPRVHAWSELQVASAEGTARQLERAERLVSEHTALANDARTAADALSRQQPALLAGSSPGQAAAALAEILERYAVTARVRMGSTSVHADSTFGGGFARVSVRAYATADIQGLAQWLDRIETSDHVLAVRELTITQPEPAAADGTPEGLSVEVLVLALVRHGASTGGRRR